METTMITAQLSELLSESAHDFTSRRHQLWIDGQWTSPAEGRTFPTHDPGTGNLISEIAYADATDVDLAVRAARTALTSKPWAAASPADRGAMLGRLAD